MLVRACLLSLLFPLLLLSLGWFAIHISEHSGSSIVATLAGAHATANTPATAAAATAASTAAAAPKHKKDPKASAAAAAAAATASNTATSAYHDAKWHLDAFHSRPEGTFFEGVYYKFVGPYSDDIIVVIAGLYLNAADNHAPAAASAPGGKGNASEAFISVVHNTKVNYYRFPVAAFRFNELSKEQLQDEAASAGSAASAAGAFSVSIGDSTFTDRSVTLSIMPDADDDASDSVMGEIVFESQTPWTTRGMHPSTMGVTGLLPHGHMPCNHHVLSMHHALHGYISVGEQLTDLEMGTGYTEKDWGTQFPTSWVWAQSNHFARLKPPKRGNTAAGVEGEVWAEEHENTEEVSEDGPGRGESSGSVSALYADHVMNHHSPVSVFLSVARVDLTPGINRLANALGLVSPLAQAHFAESLLEPNSTLPSAGITGASLGFIAGFLFEGSLRIFSSYQFDQLVRFELEEDTRSGDLKEVLHLSFVDARARFKLDVDLHKPVAINAGLKRKKDTQCLKKLVAQKNRERERAVKAAGAGGKLNPLEEAFLMDSVKKAEAENAGTAPAAPEAAQVSAAEQAAIEAGIAAARAESPDAKLAALASKPLPAAAPIVAGLYGPHHSGRMEKFVKEALIGGRIEVAWSQLRSAAAYAEMSPRQRREGQEWRAEIVGSEILYVQSLYRAIGKPAAMELMGDLSWLEHEAAHQSAMWSPATRRAVVWAMYEPFAGLMVAAAIAVIIAMVMACTSSRKASGGVAPAAGAKSKTS